MPLVSHSIPNLVNGVSQQPAAMRLPSQAEAQVNCYPSVVEGLSRRPPTKLLAKLSVDRLRYQNALVHLIDRDAVEKYAVVIVEDDLEVYDLNTGEQKTVAFPDGKGYLDNPSPRSGYRVTTAADYTFIANRAKTVTMDGTIAPARNPEALLFFRVASYRAILRLDIGPLWWQITLPGAATDDSNRDYIMTTKVAQAFYDYLFAGTTAFGYTFASNGGGTLGLLGFTGVLQGSLIYLSRATDFPLRVADGQGGDFLKGIKGSVQKMADLPKSGVNGFTVKVTGDPSEDGGEYWVQFQENSSWGGTTNSSTGTWYEVAAPGTKTSFDAATMPHILVSEGDGTFTFKRATWDKREVGDLDSVPEPSFVGRAVRDVFFAHNRLGFLAGENVIMSRAGGQQFNFWREKAIQLLASDPIDVAATHHQVSIFQAAVPFDEDVLVFAGKTQFRLTSGGDVFGPETVELKPVSEYVADTDVRPVLNGKRLYFPAVRDDNSSTVYEYAVDPESGRADGTDIASHVPSLIPGNPARIAVASTERTLVVLSDDAPRNLYAYTFLWSGNEKVQAAWHRWTFDADSRVLDCGFLRNKLVLTMLRDDGLYLETMELGVALRDTGSTYLTYLDRKVTEAQVSLSWNADRQETTVTLPYAWAGNADGFELQVVPRLATAEDTPRPMPFVQTDADTLVLPGDHRTTPLLIGVDYPSTYSFSELFVREQRSGGPTAVIQGTLQLRNMTVLLNDGALVNAEVTSRNAKDPEVVDIRGVVGRSYDALRTFDSSPITAPGARAEWLPPHPESEASIESIVAWPKHTGYSMRLYGAGVRVTGVDLYGEDGAGGYKVRYYAKTDTWYLIRDAAVNPATGYASTGALLPGERWYVLVDPAGREIHTWSPDAVTVPFEVLPGYEGRLTVNTNNADPTQHELVLWIRTDTDYELAVADIGTDQQATFWNVGDPAGLYFWVQLRTKVTHVVLDTTLSTDVATSGYPAAYTGPVRGKLTGVPVDGRFVARIDVETDIVYPGNAVEIAGNGTFFSPSSYAGTKMISVVRAVDETVVHQQDLGVGLLRSFKFQPGDDPAAKAALEHRCFVYDQAVAVVAACRMRDQAVAEKWVRGLLSSQQEDGNWAFSLKRVSGYALDPYYRTGASAWVGIALGWFLKQYPDTTLAAEVEAALDALCTHLLTFRRNNPGQPDHNLFGGGTGRYVLPSWEFDADYVIPWISTEHNIDCYFAFKCAGEVLSDSAYTTVATETAAAMAANLWIADEGRFAQGINDGGLDRASALDCHTWGALMLADAGDMTRARLAMRWAEKHRVTNGQHSGYTPYVADLGTLGAYAGAAGGIWPEGTFGAILALRVTATDQAAADEFARVAGLLTTEGYPYSTRRDDSYELQTWKNVAATGWAVIAADPGGFMGASGPALWTVVASVEVPRDRVYRYRFDGGAAEFRFPVNAPSKSAVISLHSAGPLGFHALSADWEGFFSIRSSRM